MKNTYYFLTRPHGLLLLIGALSVALFTNAQIAQPPFIQSQKLYAGAASYYTPAYIAKASNGEIGIITISQQLMKFSTSGDVLLSY